MRQPGLRLVLVALALLSAAGMARAAPAGLRAAAIGCPCLLLAMASRARAI